MSASTPSSPTAGSTASAATSSTAQGSTRYGTSTPATTTTHQAPAPGALSPRPYRPPATPSASRSITSAQADAIHAALLQARLDAITLYRINRRDRRDYDDQMNLITEAELAIGAHEALDL